MTDHKHPSDDFLRRFVAGTASRGEGRQITAHLLLGCRACAERVQELLRPGVPEGSYDAVFQRLESVPLHGAAAAAPLDAKASALLAELDALPTLRQEFLARNSRRYLSPDLARLLAQRSFDLRYQDPRPMLRAARMAVAIAERLQATTPEEAAEHADVRALCASQLCNALRITSDLTGAEQAMADALSALKSGTGDAFLKALVTQRRGALLAFQCRYEAAIRAHEEAVEIFRDLGLRHELAGALIGQAVASLYAGDPECAITLFTEAIPKIEGERDPRMTLAACHGVVNCQIEAGHIDDASLKWIELRFLYDQIGDPLVRLRGMWLEGKLMIAQGVVPAGIRLLEKARQAYSAHGMSYEAAVIALDIAQGHLSLGHREHVRSLVSEILPVLRDLEVDKYILTALAHLRRAAQQEKLRWPSSPPA